MNTYAPGARIAGQYEVASKPLIGGMGLVYLCYDHEADRPVALKTFRPEYLPDRAARDRFLREGSHWVELGNHPHVVCCYQVRHLDPEDYLVLELVAKAEGRTDASLRSWLLPGQPLPLEHALLFALQIARGMKHTASVIPGFVHRDLKPENVLVGADHLPQSTINWLRVTDFGLATILQASADPTDAASSPPAGSGLESGEQVPASSAQTPGVLGRTQLTHGIVGTPLYMAPEQWRGEEVSVATDIYALGCILYEMVCGQRAVSGGSRGALEQGHCGGEAWLKAEAVTGEVGELLRYCLAVVPEGRYGEWVEVECALAAAYDSVSGAAAPTAVGTAVLSRVYKDNKVVN